MRTSFKVNERILGALIVGLLIFMSECITHKLVTPRIDWLSYSLVWSISWTIGHYFGRTVMAKLKELKEKEHKPDYYLFVIPVLELAIFVIVGLVVSFVLGVLLNLANWNELTGRVVTSFSVSAIVNSIFEFFNNKEKEND